MAPSKRRKKTRPRCTALTTKGKTCKFLVSEKAAGMGMALCTRHFNKMGSGGLPAIADAVNVLQRVAASDGKDSTPLRLVTERVHLYCDTCKMNLHCEMAKGEPILNGETSDPVLDERTGLPEKVFEHVRCVLFDVTRFTKENLSSLEEMLPMLRLMLSAHLDRHDRALAAEIMTGGQQIWVDKRSIAISAQEGVMKCVDAIKSIMNNITSNDDRQTALRLKEREVATKELASSTGVTQESIGNALQKYHELVLAPQRRVEEIIVEGDKPAQPEIAE